MACKVKQKHSINSGENNKITRSRKILLAILLTLLLTTLLLTVKQLHYKSTSTTTSFSATQIGLVRQRRLASDSVNSEKNAESTSSLSPSRPAARLLAKPVRITFNEIITEQNARVFNISGHDMLVLLHIQKTAGTYFEKQLVYNLNISKPCACEQAKRQCLCQRPTAFSSNESNNNVNNNDNHNVSFSARTWLLSRFSTGWICGLHADWTQLDYCLQGLDGLFLATFLRHPLHRFISEFRHVQRGATWKNSIIHCPEYDNNSCLKQRKQDHWLNVTLDQFLACEHNMALNRQTRMLADIKLVGCQAEAIGRISNNTEKTINYKARLLNSAKKNLQDLAFFGLCEHQRSSQLIFEKTFNLIFKNNFEQSDDSTTQTLLDRLPPEMKHKIEQVNSLDMDLYNYATRLFRDRCARLSLNCSTIQT